MRYSLKPVFLAVYINHFFRFSNWDESTSAGWLLAGLILATVRVIQRARSAGNSSIQKAWIWLSIILLILALDKQIDLIDPVLNWFKGLSKEQGWYAYRRFIVYTGFVGGLVAAIWLAIVCRALLLKHSVVTGLIGVGGIFLCSVLFFRVATFHYVQPGSGFHFGCPRTNWIFETAGLGLILIGSFSRVDVPSSITSERRSADRKADTFSLPQR